MFVDVDASPSALLKLLGEPIRWSIVQRLAREELCVGHLGTISPSPSPW